MVASNENSSDAQDEGDAMGDGNSGPAPTAPKAKKKRFRYKLSEKIVLLNNYEDVRKSIKDSRRQDEEPMKKEIVRVISINSGVPDSTIHKWLLKEPALREIYKKSILEGRKTLALERSPLFLIPRRGWLPRSRSAALSTSASPSCGR
jgi:hypothetical protein